MQQREAAPWFEQGLRFECQPDCGACCVNHGESTYVYLEGQDAERLARHLGLELETFLASYTAEEEGHRILVMSEPECHFLDGRRCGIYEARPTQCRTFPFWPENLLSRAHWEALRAFCPGIDRGTVHDARTVATGLQIR